VQVENFEVANFEVANTQGFWIQQHTMGDNNNFPEGGSPHTPLSAVGGGGTTPPFPSTQTTSIVQVTTSPLISGLVSLSARPTSIMDGTHPAPSVTNTFSFGMSSMGGSSIPIPSQPFIQGSSSGAGSSSAPLQDFPFPGSSIAPWKDFPYIGGNISTMNPSLGGGFFQSFRPATGPSTSSGGSGGFSSNILVSFHAILSLWCFWESNFLPIHYVSDRGKPFPASVESHVRVCSLTRDVIGSNPFQSIGGKTSGGFHFTGSRNPRFLSKSGSVCKLFLETWCQFQSRAISFQDTNQSRFVNPMVSSSMSQPRIPFLETLHFPYLSKLMNDLIHHNPSWPPVPTKLPSDIPKFEGKSGEDPGDHVTMFHLWCSSNSLNDDSIQLRLFQCTLTRGTAKWYIEMEGSKFKTFGDLAMVFLNHFQLPVWYDVGTKFWLILNKIKPLTFPITFRNGGDKEFD
jgi:hypothetical protein